MKNLTKIVLGTVAATGLALTVAFLMPRAVHAVGPMTVSPTAPRTPWTGICDPLPPDATSTLAQCSITNIPATAELVITSVTFIELTGKPSTHVLTLIAPSGGHPAHPWTRILKSNSDNQINYSSSVDFYIDPTNGNGGAIWTFYDQANKHDDLGPSEFELYGYYVLPPTT